MMWKRGQLWPDLVCDEQTQLLITYSLAATVCTTSTNYVCQTLTHPSSIPSRVPTQLPLPRRTAIHPSAAL